MKVCLFVSYFVEIQRLMAPESYKSSNLCPKSELDANFNVLNLKVSSLVDTDGSAFNILSHAPSR